MTSRFTELIVDCHDLNVVADFWCAVLGYERGNAGDGWLSIRPPGQELTEMALVARPQPCTLAFVEVPETKTMKNRLHVDVTPIGLGQADEVARLMELGARTVDVGQRDRPWIVMADPEGNEFCVMPELTLS
jgi:hypothetical protein